MLRRSPAQSGRRLIVLSALLLTATACGGSPSAVRTTTPPPTPLAQLNTAAMQIPRIDFCELVPTPALRAALNQTPPAMRAYGNGATAPLGTGQDVVAEHLCRWGLPDGTATASAWIFARPVGPPFAQRIVRDARRQKGCQLITGPAFGEPTLTQVCTTAGGVRVRHAGLIGDSWLTCEVEARAPRAQVITRADQWCVAITQVLNTSR